MDKKNKIIYFSIFGFLFLIAAYLRFSHIQLPFAVKDGYANTALNFFYEKRLILHNGRNFLYPVFILIISFIFRSFSFVAIVQHIIGLLGGVVLLFSWNKMVDFYKCKYSLLYKYIGLAIYSLYQFNVALIIHEQKLMTESISISLSSFIICSLILFFRNQKSFFSNACLVFTNFMMLTIQPKWLLIFYMLIGVQFLFLVYNKVKLKSAVFIFILPIIISLTIFYIPGKVISSLANSYKSSTIFGLGHAFGTHLFIIDDIIQKDIDSGKTKYDENLLKSIHVKYTKSLKDFETDIEHKDKYKNIGYNFNDIFYGSDGIRDLIHESLITDDKIKEFYKYYFSIGVLNYPQKYAFKVIKEQLRFYMPFSGYIFAQNKVYDFSSAMKSAGKKLAERYPDTESEVINEYKKGLLENSKENHFFKAIEFPFNILYVFLQVIYLPVFIVFMIIFIYEIIKWFKDRNFYCFLPGFFSFILAISVFFMLLITSMVYILNLTRYIDEVFVLSLISEFSMILWLYNIIIEKHLNKIVSIK